MAEDLAKGIVSLADPDLSVIYEYGLQDGTLGRELARPATFLLGEDREIVWRYLPDDWKLRNGPDEYMRVFEQYRVGGD